MVKRVVTMSVPWTLEGDLLLFDLVISLDSEAEGTAFVLYGVQSDLSIEGFTDFLTDVQTKTDPASVDACGRL